MTRNDIPTKRTLILTRALADFDRRQNLKNKFIGTDNYIGLPIEYISHG